MNEIQEFRIRVQKNLLHVDNQGLTLTLTEMQKKSNKRLQLLNE